MEERTDDTTHEYTVDIRHRIFFFIFNQKYDFHFKK